MKTELLKTLSNLLCNLTDGRKKDLIIDLIKFLDGIDDTVNVDTLKLFEYDFIKSDYFIVRDIIDVVLELYDIKRYQIINKVRLINGLGLDRTYLDELINTIDIDTVNNDYIVGLYNLLSDNNLIYNNVGLRIKIVQLLKEYGINNFNVFKVDNGRLNDSFKFLTFKNNKIKNYTKLYLKDDLIIMNTLLHDDIKSVVLTVDNNINGLYGSVNDTDLYNDTVEDYQKIKDYQYTFIDKEDIFNNYLNQILRFIHNKELSDDNNKVYRFLKDDDFINVDNIDYQILNVVFKFEKQIKNNDSLKYKYNYILNMLSDIDDFKSNDIDNKTTIDDYNNYTVDLKDYFIKL